MKSLVAEWIEKAEGDVRTARRESKVDHLPNWDAVCFHAQQAVEKYLKGLLQQEGISFIKTHDLIILLEQLLPVFPDLENLYDDLEWLTVFAVEVRYPGETATKEDAQIALSKMERVISLLKSKISHSYQQEE